MSDRSTLPPLRKWSSPLAWRSGSDQLAFGNSLGDLALLPQGGHRSPESGKMTVVNRSGAAVRAGRLGKGHLIIRGSLAGVGGRSHCGRRNRGRKDGANRPGRFVAAPRESRTPEAHPVWLRRDFRELDLLFGKTEDAEQVEKLQHKFWALLRIMARKGMLTKEEFLQELGDDD